MLRHDAICRTVSKLLVRKGFVVEQEKVYRTREGARKPDIIAANESGANIIDIQIVSTARSLRESHGQKSRNMQIMLTFCVLFQTNFRFWWRASGSRLSQ